MAKKSAADKNIEIYVDDEDDIKVPMTRIEELYLKGWHIIEENENLTDKSMIFQGNTFEYCEDFSFEGGGCLRVITRNEKLYHRWGCFSLCLKQQNLQQHTIVKQNISNIQLSRTLLLQIIPRLRQLQAVYPGEHRLCDSWTWRFNAWTSHSHPRQKRRFQSHPTLQSRQSERQVVEMVSSTNTLINNNNNNTNRSVMMILFFVAPIWQTSRPWTRSACCSGEMAYATWVKSCWTSTTRYSVSDDINILQITWTIAENR